MSKLRLLIGISTAALFAVTAAQADEYYRPTIPIMRPRPRTGKSRRPSRACLMATLMRGRRCAPRIKWKTPL